MAQINVQGVSVSWGEKLFNDVTFTLGDGDRIGVVGNNGSGKTSLLRCIAGTIEPSEGTISRPKNSRLVLVEQTAPDHLMSLSLRDVVLGGIDADTRELEEWRADVVLDMFEAPEDMRDRPLSELSGGWARLALIGRAWVSEPGALMIDEPTNHLDLTKIILLERWLSSELGRTPLLLVSHDRKFLDQCTNRTLFLRPKESRLYSYSFSRARELLLDDDRALENKKDREFMELQRLRKSAHALRQIGVNNYSAAALRKSIQIAKRADAIEDSLPEIHVEPQRDVRLSSRDSHSKRLLRIQDLTVTRPDGAALFGIKQLEILKGQRVVLLGRNGTGKTQLVKRIQRAFYESQTVPDEHVSFAPSVVLGYMDQVMSQLPSHLTLEEFVGRILNAGNQRNVSTLVTAGFPLLLHNRAIGTLSPGQRARLALLELRLITPNFYLMDEPTNHVDILGQEQLEAEILKHDATGVLVSHDRTFVENTGTRFLVVEAGKLFEIETPEIFYRSLAEEVPVSTVVPRLNPL